MYRRGLMANTDVIQRWTAALRSGDYTQGTGYLAASVNGGPVKHCCLGVLAELAAQDGIVHTTTSDFHFDIDSNGDDVRTTVTRFNDHDALPGREVADWAGVDSFHADVPEGFGPRSGQEFPLFFMNDSVGMSFEDIAAVIEDKWLDAA